VKTIGHVSSEWRGRDLFLRCNHCGQTEQVADYAGGGKPRLFGWSEAGSGQLGSPSVVKYLNYLRLE